MAAVGDRKSDPFRLGKGMSETSMLRHQESVIVEASAGFLYDLLSDITRTGEWSPVCTSCW